jgi:hypothetical protein
MSQSVTNHRGQDTPDAAAAHDRRDVDQPLSDSRLGDEDAGGLAGQGGMRDPDKTSDPNPLKPS